MYAQSIAPGISIASDGANSVYMANFHVVAGAVSYDPETESLCIADVALAIYTSASPSGGCLNYPPDGYKYFSLPEERSLTVSFPFNIHLDQASMNAHYASWFNNTPPISDARSVALLVTLYIRAGVNNCAGSLVDAVSLTADGCPVFPASGATGEFPATSDAVTLTAEYFGS